LTSGQGFALAVRRGQRAAARHLVVHLWMPPQPTSAGSPARVGFVVSKAVGPAVVRNRVKRRLRAVVAPGAGSLPADAICVVRALPAAGSASSADLARSWQRALERLAPARSDA